MSKPYRIHVDHDGWRWIGTPDQPTGFVALPHTSGHVAHRIVEELNGLLHAHDAQKARAEKALDEAIARADKASNALIRTTAALRETTTRAEKAEARVAALEGEAESWSRVFKAKTAPQTPVPAPEGTETVQKAPPPSPVGASRNDRGSDSAGQVGNPGPGRSDSRASESSNLDMSIPRPSRMPLGIVEAWQDGDRVFGTYAGGPQVELVPVPPDDGPVRTFVVKDSEADAFRVYDEMLRYPGHPQRGLTAEEADAWTELLGKFGSPKPREPDVSAEVGLMGALQDRIHKEAGPYRAAKAVRVEASPRPTRPPPGICELWERDGRYFGKYAEDGPDVELSVAQPDTGLVRVLVDPAAAAEVEARTGEVALKKQAEVWRDAVLESIPKRRCEGCANGTALAAHSLCPACVAKSEAAAIGAYDATLRRWAEFFTPPRAGLPSRDEVAAFLEARWPK